MAQNRMMPPALLEQLQGADTDVLRRVLEHAMQRLIEAEAATQIGAGPHERSANSDHVPQRLPGAGPRHRVGTPRAADPQAAYGQLLPVVARAAAAYRSRPAGGRPGGLRARHQYPQGRRPHGRAGRLQHQSQRGEPDLCAARRRARRVPRPPARRAVSVRLVRHDLREGASGARIVSQAAVVAVGVRDTGQKSVLGLAIGASETESFWLEFCRSLARRRLSGVQLVISDALEGLRSALSQVFAGATWQRCKVHFLRNVANAFPKLHAPAVLAVVKSIFLQPTERPPETRSTTRSACSSHAFPRWPPSSVLLKPTCSPTWTSP